MKTPNNCQITRHNPDRKCKKQRTITKNKIKKIAKKDNVVKKNVVKKNVVKENLLKENLVKENIVKENIVKKVYVFDLDNTLFLHNSEYEYAKKYHKDVELFLMKLKMENKKLYIASHNRDPYWFLDIINIRHLFDDVIYEKKHMNRSINTISEYTSKKDMILEIMEKEMCDISEIIFFDDHNYNISQVESINVKSIKVDPIKGIDFSINYNQI